MTAALLIATLLSSVVALWLWAQLVITAKANEERVRGLFADIKALETEATELRAELADAYFARDLLQRQLNATAARRPVSAVEGVLGRIGGWFG